MAREGEVVLIYYQDQPAMFARIEAIEPDIKKDWYRVTFLLLTIPSQIVNWILREEYIDGAPFTMGGQSLRLEEVKRVLPQDQTRKSNLDPDQNTRRKSGKAKVVSFKKERKD